MSNIILTEKRIQDIKDQRIGLREAKIAEFKRAMKNFNGEHISGAQDILNISEHIGRIGMDLAKIEGSIDVLDYIR
jgi:hypothetical protein